MRPNGARRKRWRAQSGRSGCACSGWFCPACWSRCRCTWSESLYYQQIYVQYSFFFIRGQASSVRLPGVSDRNVWHASHRQSSVDHMVPGMFIGNRLLKGIPFAKYNKCRMSLGKHTVIAWFAENSHNRKQRVVNKHNILHCTRYHGNIDTTIWYLYSCWIIQRQLVKSNATFNAFLMSGAPPVAEERTSVSMTRNLLLSDDMKEYWGFYLLKGSTVTVSTCARYEWTPSVIFLSVTRACFIGFTVDYFTFTMY